MNKNTLFAKRLPLFLQISWKPPQAPADMATTATLHVHGPQPPHQLLFPFARALSHLICLQYFQEQYLFPDPPNTHSHTVSGRLSDSLGEGFRMPETEPLQPGLVNTKKSHGRPPSHELSHEGRTGQRSVKSTACLAHCPLFQK